MSQNDEKFKRYRFVAVVYCTFAANYKKMDL